jgi:ATP-binding cassette subfamily B protein
MNRIKDTPRIPIIKNDGNILSMLHSLWRTFSSQRRMQFKWLFLLIFFASFSELMSIGALLPFLAILISPERFFASPIAQILVSYMNIGGPIELLLPLTIIFVVLTFFAGFIRILLLWVSIRISYAIGSDLSVDIYRRTLYRPYTFHCEQNSSEIIDAISNKSTSLICVVTNCLNLISSGFILVTLLFGLLLFNPFVTLCSFAGFLIIYLLIGFLTRNQQRHNSSRMARESSRCIKVLQEGIGGIRDILIDGSQKIYCHKYQSSDLFLRKAQASNLFISSSPRYIVESLGIMLIALLAFTLTRGENAFDKTVPILGVFAMAAQRMLPLFQQIYASWVGISGARVALGDVLELLTSPLPSDHIVQNCESLSFMKEIELRNISFQFSSKEKYILRNLNLTISKGDRIGIVGITGSGKSTLVDMLMGLLEPTKGQILIDGQTINRDNRRAWQDHIAHVPQNIYLADCTIEQNIAFGVDGDLIDSERVVMAARQAQLSSTIESWPLGYKTIVGERGIRLSGGQRQRIGVARALYKSTADVIIFDEATSALDSKTEREVIDAIETLSPEITLIMIAHRLSTLDNCTKVINLDSGTIRE